MTAKWALSTPAWLFAATSPAKPIAAKRLPENPIGGFQVAFLFSTQPKHKWSGIRPKHLLFIFQVAPLQSKGYLKLITVHRQ